MRGRGFHPIVTALAALGIVAAALAAIGDALARDTLRHAFATKEFRKALRPVIDMETVNAGPRGAADEYLPP